MPFARRGRALVRHRASGIGHRLLTLADARCPKPDVLLGKVRDEIGRVTRNPTLGFALLVPTASHAFCNLFFGCRWRVRLQGLVD